MSADFSAEERALLGRVAQPEPPPSMRGWYPLLADPEHLWWRHFGDKRFSEPFFHDTVFALGRHQPYVQTGYDALAAFDDTLAPSAFIFHTSRCGSTLLAQLLALLPDTVVMSEPPVIDAFLATRHARQDEADSVQPIRRIVAALGQRRFGRERHYFIKLDSWHIGALPLLRQAFPDTPCIFLYRRPDEVLASHCRQRGRQMVPGLVAPTLLRPDTSGLAPGDLDGYGARVLALFFEAACRHSDELLLFNYTQLPQLTWETLPELFGICCPPATVAAMRARAGLHAKRGEPFTGDPMPVDHTAANNRCTTLLPLYDRLERLRLGRIRA